VPTREAALWPGGGTNVKAGSRASMTRQGEEREKRLAEALRENLRRRKAQAREAPRHPGEGRDPGTPSEET